MRQAIAAERYAHGERGHRRHTPVRSGVTERSGERVERPARGGAWRLGERAGDAVDTERDGGEQRDDPDDGAPRLHGVREEHGVQHTAGGEDGGQRRHNIHIRHRHEIEDQNREKHRDVLHTQQPTVSQ